MHPQNGALGRVDNRRRHQRTEHAAVGDAERAADEFVIVNIAGFQAMLVRDRDIVWTTRAQVGKTYRKSPVFASNMKYLVIRTVEADDEGCCCGGDRPSE